MQPPQDHLEEQAPPAAPPTAPEDAQAFEQLREILVGQERADLDELRDTVAGKRLEPDEVGRILPAAVRARGDEDPELTAALTPSVESAIEISVKRNPGVLVDAIFPVIGPAIRRSIKEALGELTQRVNQTLEHGLSPRGLSWRMQAWRTGVPFSEVVLRNSLVWRIEQAFLIHRETCLLLAHATDPTAGGSVPDTVSAMLSAIQGFVSDSFESEEGVDQIEFGGQVLEIAHGPTAVLACVVRGSLPPAQRQRLAETLEQIHGRKAEQLRAFDGDSRAFEDTLLALEELLVEERPPERGVRWQRLVFWPALVVGLSFLVGWWILSNLHEAEVWRDARAALAAEPGLVLLVDRRTDDGYVIGGLRDPLATDPDDILREAGLDPDQVEARWAPFVSEDPAIAEHRARTLLEPPTSATLDLVDGRLVLAGTAGHPWLQAARAAFDSGALPGVAALDTSGLVDTDLQRALELAGPLTEGLDVDFASGEARLASTATADQLTDRWAALAAHAATADLSVTLRIDFEPDAAGDPLLTWQRRDLVVRLLTDAAAAAPEVAGELLLDRPGGDRATLTVGFGSEAP